MAAVTPAAVVTTFLAETSKQLGGAQALPNLIYNEK